MKLLSILIALLIAFGVPARAETKGPIYDPASKSYFELALLWQT